MRQKQRRHAAVGIGDDPQAVVAIPVARLGGVDGVRRQDAASVEERREVGSPVIGANGAPVPPPVAAQTIKPLRMCGAGHGAGRGNNPAKLEQRNGDADWHSPRAGCASCKGNLRGLGAGAASNASEPRPR